MELSSAEDHLLRGAGVHLHASADAVGPSAEQTPSEIYLENAPLMRRIATGRFGIPAPDAENLVHDVFISYLSNPQRVLREVRPYLVAAICNASRHYWRDHQSESRVFDREAEVDETSGIAAAAQEGLADTMLVAAALARLDHRCRRILESYYMRGESTPVIARELMTSNGNVHYLMHCCRRRVKEIFRSLSRRKG